MDKARTSGHRRVLVVRGDLNSYSGYSYATRLYLSWLEADFDIVLGVDLHGHPARHVAVWPYPLIEDNLVPSVLAQPDTDVVVLTISTPDNFRPFRDARNIGLFFWETPRLGNQDWIAAMNRMDDIWVPAAFMAPMLESEGVRPPVTFVPCPMPPGAPAVDHTHEPPSLLLREIDLSGTANPRYVTLAELRASSRFLCLSTNSFIPRKGFPVLADEWLGLLPAFGDAALVLKVSTIDVTETGDRLFERVETLFRQVSRRHAATQARVYICTGSLTPEVMRGLAQTCDAFLTLSFGEGLGLGLFENLLSGKPVICPRHTSFAEFLPDDYPYFVDTEVENFGLADPVGVNPISARWGVPREGSLRGAVARLADDLANHRTAAAVDGAIAHFREVSRQPAWEH